MCSSAPAAARRRQNNQFFYLTGVVEPRALLWLDGRTHKATVYLPPNDERRRRQILITDAGYENLSASVPIEIEEIERTMQEPGLRRR